MSEFWIGAKRSLWTAAWCVLAFKCLLPLCDKRYESKSQRGNTISTDLLKPQMKQKKNNKKKILSRPRNDSIVSFTPQVSLNNWFWERETRNGKRRLPGTSVSQPINSICICSYVSAAHTVKSVGTQKTVKKSGAEQAASNRFVSRSPALDTTKQSRWVPIIIASQKESSWAADKRCALLWIPRMRNRIRNWIQIEIRGVCCHCLFMTVYCQC